MTLLAVGIAESGLDQPFDYGKQLGRPRDRAFARGGRNGALRRPPFVGLNLRELCIELRQKDQKATVTLELSNETSPGVRRPICAFERPGGGKFLDHELQICRR